MTQQSDPRQDSTTSTQRSSAAAQQKVTPELRRWIIEQTQAGCTQASLLQSMRSSGWNEQVAAEALESTLHQLLVEPAAPQSPPASMPGPRLDESPTRVDCGDRTADVLLSMEQPRIVVFGNLLAPEECEALIAAAASRMARSLTVAPETGAKSSTTPAPATACSSTAEKARCCSASKRALRAC